MLSHILCTDIMGEEILLPVDFMFANRGKWKRPPEPGDDRGKVIKIDKDRVQMVDCTIVHIHEEMGIAVLETPAQIRDLLIEAHTYDDGQFVIEEPDEDPDQEDPDDPARGAVVPKLLASSE